MADNKKILITGASGLIGRELCRQLVEHGHKNITAVDSNWKYPGHKVSNVRFIKSDTVDYIRSTINNYNVIYHLSAINGTKYFYNIPNELIENNVLTDIEMFKWAKTNPDTKLIYASSSEVVADSPNIPTAEEVDVYIKNIHNPRWSYRLGKMLSENYLTNSDINYVIVRFFNTYSEHTASGHIVKDLTEKIQNGNFELYGATETRSFCYVSDAVSAIIKLAETVNRDIVNVGSDEELTVMEVAEILCQAQGINNAKWTTLENLEGSTARRKPNLKKLRSFVPDYRAESFQSTINRIKKYLTNSK